MNMDIDISDDLQELRERLEGMGQLLEASIVTRAALEIARLRGEASTTEEDAR